MRRAEPWLVAHLRAMQLSAAAVVVVIALPGMHWEGEHWPLLFPGAAMLFGLLVSPLLLFLPLGKRARAAFHSSPGWASIGRVAGCYFAAVAGMASMLWAMQVIAHDRSSTAALALIVVPLLWTALGLVGHLALWGLGSILDRQR